LDVGANVGLWAVPLAQRGTVHAFEPIPANAARLHATGNAALVIDDSDDRFDQLTVGLDTLDHQAAGLGLERIDVVKVDIEGHEDAFVIGGRSTLARSRPVIFMELNRAYFDQRQVSSHDVFSDA